DLAIPGVGADHDAAWMSARHFLHEPRIGERCGAQDHASDAGLQPGFHTGAVANAAAQLDGKRDGGADGADRLRIDASAGERAIQIHAMKPAKALARKASRLRGGIGIEDGSLFHQPALQPHALAVLEIDGGEDDHGDQERKLASSRRPTAWLFSGWNCVPTILARPTAAVTGLP